VGIDEALALSAAMTGFFTSRPAWRTVPADLRLAVERCAGGSVVASRDVHGGMSPGPAAALSLDTGLQVFVKAMNRTVNAGSHQLYRREAAALRVMPLGAPAARLVGVVEIGDWIVLITHLVPGLVAGPPWTTPAIRAVADACAELRSFPAPDGVPPVLERLPDLDGWAALAADPGGLTPWEVRHVERLAAAAAGWRSWTRGRQLTHLDIRCDNAIVDMAGRTAVLVDWGYCAAGAPWLDRALLAADVMGAGHVAGPEAARRRAWELLADQPAEASRFVIAQAGMWRRNSTLPAHPGMPTHRAWQRTRAAALQPLLEDLLAGPGAP
jgi:aminoglycoside phosphotransferase (APT) family kinase protein